MRFRYFVDDDHVAELGLFCVRAQRRDQDPRTSVVARCDSFTYASAIARLLNEAEDGLAAEIVAGLSEEVADLLVSIAGQSS